MFQYIALGDSITAGERATSRALAYPSLVVSKLQVRTPAVASILAEPGWTSTDLRVAVYEHFPYYLSTADAVSIWIGGDNVAHAGISMLRGAPIRTVERAISRYTQDIGSMVQMIRRVSQAPIILCTQYNPFPNTALAAEAIGALNAATVTTGATLRVAVAPVHTWFEGRQSQLIFGYRTGQIQDALRSPQLPIHPNNAGHRLIAEGLAPFVGVKGG